MTEPSTQTPNTETPQRTKGRDGRSKGLLQAYELRDLAHKAAMKFKSFEPVTDEAATASAREIASLIRAWSEADDHVRIHRNKPLPGSLRPVAKVKRSAKTRLEPSPIPQEPLAPVSQAPV